VPRVSFKAKDQAREPKANHTAPYVASQHYGTRRSEKNKQVIRFGRNKATIYRRSDIEHSSWFLRIHLTEEGRHYRKSLRTLDREEALNRAHDTVLDVLTKVNSGERILSLSLSDLVRRFTLHQDSLEKSGQLSSKTVAVQAYRVRLGCEFLKTHYLAGMETKISTVDGAVFKNYLTWRQEQVAKKREHGTIRRDVVRDELLVIRKMFKYAKLERLCGEKSIPSWDFEVERDAPKRRRITFANYRDFINTTYAWVKEAKDTRDQYHRRILAHVVALAALAGMRSGEIFGLLNSDVQMRGVDECLVRIRAETSKVRRERSITVDNKMLVLWLTKYQRHRDPSDYVYSPYNDGKTSARDVFYHAYKSLRVRLKEIDLDWFDLYHCRHWYATNRLLAEEAIYSIGQVMGTGSREIESTYSHVLTELTTKRFSKKKIVWDPNGSYKIVQKLNSV
jgi:cation transport regulator ChaB